MSDLGTQTLQVKLARYTLNERIGAGGMATVYRAWDNNLERDVAIKVLHEHLSFDNTFQERFIREAKFVAGFHHPHIVQIFDFAMIETKDIPIYYMVMPYLTGETLEHLISERTSHNMLIDSERIIILIEEIASALDYAHERGMIHRDVKPANILYDSHQRAILTDFGIARLAETNKLTAEGLTIGTPAYMPPEQAQGIEIDHRADIYSLGVIAYELLTGHPPYGVGSVSVMLEHINAPIPRISDSLDIPNQALDAIFRRILAKNPDERHQTASDFAIELKQIVQGDKVTAEPQITKILEVDVVAPEQNNEPLDYDNHKPKRIEKASSQSPLALVAMGLGLVAFILVVALLIQMPDMDAPISGTSNDDIAESMTGEQFFDTKFSTDDGLLESWDQTSTDFLTREIIDGQFLITNNRANTATTTLFDPAYQYEDVTITMNAHLIDAVSSASGYGIVFRYKDAENYNVFAVDGRGRFSIWVRDSGVWRELRNANTTWTENEAVNSDSESNLLRVEIYQDTLTGYVNGTEVVQIVDDTIGEGAIGIYLATTRQGMARISVDGFSVNETTPVTSSMTDDTEGVSESMTDDG